MSEDAAWGERIVEWARRFHVEYEYQAKRFGWKSQTPVDFEELPEANKQTMLGTVAAVMGSEVYPREREIESLRAEVTRLESLISAPRECPTNHGKFVKKWVPDGSGNHGWLKQGSVFTLHKTPFCPDCGQSLKGAGE